MREQWRALSDDSRHALHQGCGNQIALTCNPAWVTNDVKGVIFRCVEHGAHGVAHPAQPAAMCVHYTFRLARRSRCVNDKQRKVGVDALNRQYCVEFSPQSGRIFGSEDAEV